MHIQLNASPLTSTWRYKQAYEKLKATDVLINFSRIKKTEASAVYFSVIPRFGVEKLTLLFFYLRLAETSFVKTYMISVKSVAIIECDFR